jgi:hypothetical protein
MVSQSVIVDQPFCRQSSPLLCIPLTLFFHPASQLLISLDCSASSSSAAAGGGRTIASSSSVVQLILFAAADHFCCWIA